MLRISHINPGFDLIPRNVVIEQVVVLRLVFLIRQTFDLLPAHGQTLPQNTLWEEKGIRVVGDAGFKVSTSIADSPGTGVFEGQLAERRYWRRVDQQPIAANTELVERSGVWQSLDLLPSPPPPPPLEGPTQCPVVEGFKIRELIPERR